MSRSVWPPQTWYLRFPPTPHPPSLPGGAAPSRGEAGGPRGGGWWRLVTVAEAGSAAPHVERGYRAAPPPERRGRHPRRALGGRKGPLTPLTSRIRSWAAIRGAAGPPRRGPRGAALVAWGPQRRSEGFAAAGSCPRTGADGGAGGGVSKWQSVPPAGSVVQTPGHGNSGPGLRCRKRLRWL